MCQLRKEADVPVSDVRERLGIYPLRFRAGLALLEDEARVLLTGKGREMRISIVPSNTGNPAPHNWPEVGH